MPDSEQTLFSCIPLIDLKSCKMLEIPQLMASHINIFMLNLYIYGRRTIVANRYAAHSLFYVFLCESGLCLKGITSIILANSQTVLARA